MELLKYRGKYGVGVDHRYHADYAHRLNQYLRALCAELVPRL